MVHRVRMKSKNFEETVFDAKYGWFEYLVIPIGHILHQQLS